MEFRLFAKPDCLRKDKNASQGSNPLELKIDWQTFESKSFIIVSIQNNSSQDFIWNEIEMQNMFRFTLQEENPFYNRYLEYNSSSLVKESSFTSEKIIIEAGKAMCYKYEPEEIFKLLFKKDDPPRFDPKSKYFISVSLEDNSQVPPSIQKLHSDRLPLVIFLDNLANTESTPQIVMPDQIDLLVTELSSSHGLLMNGAYPILGLPDTASTEEVVSKTFKMTSFDKGHVESYKILQIRLVRILGGGSLQGGSLPDLYTAVLVETTLGKKIVLFRYDGKATGLWSRVYDAKTSADVKTSMQFMEQDEKTKVNSP